jgi:hypothetical protein
MPEETTETPPETPEETAETAPQEPDETPAPEVETPAVSSPDPEPGSPRRKRPREQPGITIPRLDVQFWQQLIESRSTREASRRERYTNLLHF